MWETEIMPHTTGCYCRKPDCPNTQLQRIIWLSRMPVRNLSTFFGQTIRLLDYRKDVTNPLIKSDFTIGFVTFFQRQPAKARLLGMTTVLRPDRFAHQRIRPRCHPKPQIRSITNYTPQTILRKNALRSHLLRLRRVMVINIHKLDIL